ncbi:MAG: protein jag [Clostridia bacterium]|nr:protein jag [Clostridia bacterium]
MLKQVTVSEKTVEQAVNSACEQLGVGVDEVEYEVIEEPKRGILGIGASDAKVTVTLKETPATRAVEFLENLVKNMDLEAEVVVTEKEEDGISINVNGDSLGLLIGRRGDVLDAIQYLTTISANLGKEDFYRVNVDIRGYREKRAETLRGVARRMSEKVLKYKKSFALEPMNAYERRIIHAECQNIEGVTTRSVGEGVDRKVIISPVKK